MLGPQHALELVVRHRRRRRGRPVRELLQDIEGQRAARVDVGIVQPGEDLVHRVPRDADELTAADGILELRRTVGERAHEPGSRLFLTSLQLPDDVVDALLHALVRSGRIHEGGRGEVVTERVAVAADIHPRLLGFPAAVHGRLRFETCVHPKVVKHPVRLQREQVPEVPLLRVEERTVQQAHVMKRER